MSALHRSRRPGRGQGMVEYIMLVCLIAIALISIISVASGPGSFGYAVDEAIQGSTGKVRGAAGAMGGNSDAERNLSGENRKIGTTNQGHTVYENAAGNRVIEDGSPYVPATHGNL